jgi:hypothetical protein
MIIYIKCDIFSIKWEDDMKIGVENLGFKDSQYERDKKINKVSAFSNKDLKSAEINIQNTNLEIKDTYIQIQHDIASEQTKLNGFLTVQERLEDNNQYSTDENMDFLTELIANTKLKDEQILLQYEDQLADILSNNNAEQLKTLIKATEGEILIYSARIDSMDQTQTTAMENLLSVKSNLKKAELDALMQEVVTKLKESDIPDLNLAREKIIDLL